MSQISKLKSQARSNSPLPIQNGIKYARGNLKLRQSPKAMVKYQSDATFYFHRRLLHRNKIVFRALYVKLGQIRSAHYSENA